MKNEAKKIRVFDIQLGTTEIVCDFFSYFTVTYFDIRYMNKNKQSFSSNGDASSSTFQLQLAAVSRFWTLYARKQKKGVSLQLDIKEVSWTRSKPWI